MKVKNTTVQHSADELMQHDMDSARKCYSRSKDSIIEAIAYAFRVYQATETYSNAATKIEDEIATRNSKIGGHNKREHHDRERAKKLAAKKLSAKKLGKKEAGRLRAIAALSDEAWKVKHIKLTIEARTEENACTRIVKHLFDLDSRADAPNVSRYTKAMRWVAANCAKAENAPEVVAVIKAAGRIDKIIELQRLADKTPEDVEDETSTRSRAADVGRSTTKPKSSHRAALNRAAPLASFKMKMKAEQNDLFLMVGRYRKGKFQILKAAELSDDGLDLVIEMVGAAPAAESKPPPKSAARVAA